MAWVRIDDHFDEHPKMQRVGPVAWGFWLAGLAYCNRNLTDGFIPWNKARVICSFEVVEDDGKVWDLSRTSGHTGEDITTEWIIDLLLDAGLWEEVTTSQGRIEGYRIHDYPDYQPLKSEVEAERAKKVSAGQAGGQASAQARAQARAQSDSKHVLEQNPTNDQAKSNPVPNPVPIASDEAIKEPPGSPPSHKPKQRHRLPKDWMPTDEHRARLLVAGYLLHEIEIEIPRFQRHHWHKGDAGLEWDLAFTNWMATSRQFARPTIVPPPNGMPPEIARLPHNNADRLKWENDHKPGRSA